MELKEVKTKYSETTKDIGKYLRHKIRNAKDIEKVFNNLRKQDYTVTTSLKVSETVANSYVKQAIITGKFNGNTFNVIVYYKDKEPCEDGFKQEIYAIQY